MTRPVDQGQPAPPSLRARLLRHVLLPLSLIGLAGTVASALVANHFTQRAFDRSLLDDAYAIAASVRKGQGGLEFPLSSREVKAVLFDQVETVYFAVLQADGTQLAGNASLRMAPPQGEQAYRFSDIQYRGRALRAVRLQLAEPAPFEVITAHTIHSRSVMLRSALLYSVASQLLLLVVLALWLGRSIRRELRPLAQFQQALDGRDARDLTPLAVTASTRDLQRLGAAVNDLLARVAQGVQAQQQFAGNVAHELRTPLAGIRALASYGLAHKEPAVWREQLAGIVHSEARASHLVDQLLALALADEARGSLRLQPVPLEPLVREAVLRFLPRADAAGVDLGAQGLEQPCSVQGQPLLIEGVLNNLIDNALRYGRPPDGAAPQVTVALAQEGQGPAASVVLSVLDNGPGIAAPERQRLLQRWARGSEGERLGQGAGLGLGIVTRYAELLGARLELRPAPEGHGLWACLVFAADAQ
ncbi:MAG TPA: sensor histidine kinase N-terminal domain-containing protein [Alicycliphilus sp.]|nr:sensor histidine kinase N-terminal domain-containing protein [Alicycliphilus sp.]